MPASRRSTASQGDRRGKRGGEGRWVGVAGGSRGGERWCSWCVSRGQGGCGPVSTRDRNVALLAAAQGERRIRRAQAPSGNDMRAHSSTGRAPECAVRSCAWPAAGAGECALLLAPEGDGAHPDTRLTLGRAQRSSPRERTPARWRESTRRRTDRDTLAERCSAWEGGGGGGGGEASRRRAARGPL